MSEQKYNKNNKNKFQDIKATERNRIIIMSYEGMAAVATYILAIMFEHNFINSNDVHPSIAA